MLLNVTLFHWGHNKQFWTVLAMIINFIANFCEVFIKIFHCQSEHCSVGDIIIFYREQHGSCVKAFLCIWKRGGGSAVYAGGVLKGPQAWKQRVKQ